MPGIYAVRVEPTRMLRDREAKIKAHGDRPFRLAEARETWGVGFKDVFTANWVELAFVAKWFSPYPFYGQSFVVELPAAVERVVFTLTPRDQAEWRIWFDRPVDEKFAGHWGVRFTINANGRDVDAAEPFVPGEPAA